MYDKYLSDPEIKAIVGDESLIRKMLGVEVALARVEAGLGIIPRSSAQEIAEVLERLRPEPEKLIDGSLQNGIPTIPLLALARKALSPEARDHLHWGATSQDILDTGTVLIIRDVAIVFSKRLYAIIDNLEKLAREYGDVPVVARTRTQQAVPITFGRKVEQWSRPLQRHLDRLDQLLPRVLNVQFGGAGGDRAALGAHGEAVARILAEELNLNYIDTWHTQRDNLAEWAAWLALVCGSLGKMAGDILLLAQTEVGELRESEAGGGSSTMPHKNNPVRSEAIVALARFAGQLAGNHFQAMLHQQERDGAAWALEWLTLPQLMIVTGTALNHALAVSADLQLNQEAMHANLEQLNGLIFSERATFLLAEHVGRQEAKKRVEQACRLVGKENIHLAEALERVVPEVGRNWRESLYHNEDSNNH